MSKSDRKFQRWVPHDQLTWSYQIFQEYNGVLHQILNTHLASETVVYASLKAQGAKWSDHPSKFINPKGRDLELYRDLKEWSVSYKQFDNWVTLSRILTIASTIETYLASVIELALSSDPGLLFGVSKKIDGATILKHKTRSGFDPTQQITACTKGNWSSRLHAFERIFGECPEPFKNAHSSLEELRNIRNRFGHAFGRDIDLARKRGPVNSFRPMEVVSRERANTLWKNASLAIRAIDTFLLSKHIGDFEAVRFYHELLPEMKKHTPKTAPRIFLKKSIGSAGARPRGKIYCDGLIAYWDAL